MLQVKFCSKWHSSRRGNIVWKLVQPWNKDQRPAINFDLNIFPCFANTVSDPNVLHLPSTVLEKLIFQHFPPYTCKEKKNCPFHTELKGQPKFIIWINFKDLLSKMRHERLQSTQLLPSINCFSRICLNSAQRFHIFIYIYK